MYEEIEIFGEKVRVKNYACSSIKNNIVKQDVKLNLYIKINDACNANFNFVVIDKCKIWETLI